MDIYAVRVALAAAVEAGVTPASGDPALVAVPYTPDAVTPPMFYTGEVVVDPAGVFGGQTTGPAFDVVDITCRVLTSRSDDAEGQRLLDGYLRRTGSTSVRAAIYAARGAPGEYALDGACDDLAITAIQGYRLYRVGEVAYFGAEIIVRCVGDGSGD